VNDGSWNFPSQQTGVAVGPQSRVTIHGGSISGNGIAGIDVDASGSGTTMLAIDAVLLAHNGRALHAVASGPQSVLTMGIIRSVMQQNWGGAVAVTGAAPATAIVTLTGNTIADNGSNTGDAGVSVQGSGATLLASDNSVARNNDVGLAQTAGATLGTLGNNAIHQLTPWAPTSGTITPFPGY
jgi:hypothetical protein